MGQQNDSFNGVWEGLAASFPSVTQLGIYSSLLDTCFEFLGLQSGTLDAHDCWPNLDALTVTYRIADDETCRPSYSSDLKRIIGRRKDAGIPVRSIALSRDILRIVVQANDLDWLKEQSEFTLGEVHLRSWKDHLATADWPDSEHNVIVSPAYST